MRTTHFETVDEFVEAILCEVEEENSVSVFAFKNDIVPLVGPLLFLGDFDISYLEMYDPEWNGYDAEFSLSINDGKMYIEPIYDMEAKVYLHDECNVAFIHEDCNAKILGKVDASRYYEYRVSELNGEDEVFVEKEPEPPVQKKEEDDKAEAPKSDREKRAEELAKIIHDIVYDETFKKELDEFLDDITGIRFIKLL